MLHVVDPLSRVHFLWVFHLPNSVSFTSRNFAFIVGVLPNYSAHPLRDIFIPVALVVTAIIVYELTPPISVAVIKIPQVDSILVEVRALLFKTEITWKNRL